MRFGKVSWILILLALTPLPLTPASTVEGHLLMAVSMAATSVPIALVSTSTESVLPTIYSSIEEIKKYVEEQSDILKLPRKLTLYILEHESRFCKPSDMEGDLFYKKGKLVRARGCWQITQYYHPEVTDEQAYDLAWSTDWALNKIKNKKTCIKEFTTCRVYYNL